MEKRKWSRILLSSLVFFIVYLMVNFIRYGQADFTGAFFGTLGFGVVFGLLTYFDVKNEGTKALRNGKNK